MISSRYLFTKRNGYNYPSEKSLRMNLELLTRLENTGSALVECGMGDNAYVYRAIAQAISREVERKYN